MPQNITWTYQISAVIASLLEDALINNLKKIKYVDTNIYDIEKFAKTLQNKILNKDEEIQSIDVKEMFNKIDKFKLMNILKRYIDNKKYNAPILMSMIEYDIQGSNLALYNHKIYKQNKGVPMGACTSSLYAKIYLDYYITLNQAALKEAGLIELYKYVDDILIICKKEKIVNIIDILSKETNLEYKIEKADKEGVEYLDLKIETTEEGRIIIRKNRKEYMSNRSINAMSAQCWKTKMATITNMFQRSVNLSSKERLYDVIQKDVEIIINNGFTLKCVEKALSKTYFKYKDELKEMTKDKASNDSTAEKMEVLKENIQTISIQRKQLTRKKAQNLKNGKGKVLKAMKIKAAIKRKESSKIIKKYKVHKKGINLKEKTNYIRTPYLNELSARKAKAKIQIALKQKQRFAMKTNKEWRMGNIIAKKKE